MQEGGGNNRRGGIIMCMVKCIIMGGTTVGNIHIKIQTVITKQKEL